MYIMCFYFVLVTGDTAMTKPSPSSHNAYILVGEPLKRAVTRYLEIGAMEKRKTWSSKKERREKGGLLCFTRSGQGRGLA